MTCVSSMWSTCCSDVMCVCVTGAVWCFVELYDLCGWSTCCSDVMCVCVTGAVWCSWSSMTCVFRVHVVVTSCVFVLQVLCGVRWSSMTCVEYML